MQHIWAISVDKPGGLSHKAPEVGPVRAKCCPCGGSVKSYNSLPKVKSTLVPASPTSLNLTF